MKIKSLVSALPVCLAVVFTVVLFQNCNSSSGFSASPTPEPSTDSNNNDSNNDSNNPITPSGSAIALVAGGISGIGNINGSLSDARYYLPKSATIDSKGNIFLIGYNDSTIRRINRNGVVSIFAGKPSQIGNSVGEGTSALFGKLTDITIDSSDNLYVTDASFCLIKKISPSGSVSIVSGFLDSCGYVNGSVDVAKFSDSLIGIAVDESGNIFVSERNSHTIRKISNTGIVSTFAGSPGISGATNGNSTDARFQYPENLAFDFDGNLFVSDAGNRQIRKISASGVVSKYAGMSNTTVTTGNLATVNIGQVSDLVWKSDSELFYSSGTTIFKVTDDNNVSVFSGSNFSGFQNGDASNTTFGSALGLVYNKIDSIFLILDQTNHLVRIVGIDGSSSSYSGAPHLDGDTDGPYDQARFQSIKSMAANSAGDLFLLDQGGYKLKTVSKEGIASTLPGDVDLIAGESIVFDSKDNLYISIPSKNIILKRTSSGIFSIYAGQKNISGLQDGPIASSLFYTPMGLAIDTDDNLYVADRNNGRIRKILPTGIVESIAVSTQIPNSNATLLQYPTHIAVGPDRSLYFTESSTHWIGKVTPSGNVSLLAGNPYEDGLDNGNRASSRFNRPTSLSVDSSGAIYVVDSNNRLIRKIEGDSVSTFAGLPGYYGAKIGNLPGPIGNVSFLLYLGDRLLFSDSSTVFQIKK